MSIIFHSRIIIFYLLVEFKCDKRWKYHDINSSSYLQNQSRKMELTSQLFYFHFSFSWKYESESYTERTQESFRFTEVSALYTEINLDQLQQHANDGFSIQNNKSMIVYSINFKFLLPMMNQVQSKTIVWRSRVWKV